jgi:hypothetical protein
VSLRHIHIIVFRKLPKKHYSPFETKRMNKQLTNTSLKIVTTINLQQILFCTQQKYICGIILSILDIILNAHINSLFSLHV